MPRRVKLWTLALGIALAPGVVGAQTFMGLGGGNAEVVSADGSVVAGFGWRWTAADGWTSLGIEGVRSSVDGISADGSFLVGKRWHPRDFCRDEGFLWMTCPRSSYQALS